MPRKGYKKGFTIFIVGALALILVLSIVLIPTLLGSFFGSHAREGSPSGESPTTGGETGGEEDVIATGPCSAAIKKTPMRTNLATVSVPIWRYTGPSSKTQGTHSLRVHKNCAETIKKIFQTVYDDPAQPPISTGDTGCYAVREPKYNKRTGKYWYSNHNWGIACDINHIENWCYNCYGKTGSHVGKFWKPGDIQPDRNKAGWSSGFDSRSIPINSVIANAFKSNGWGRGLYSSFNDFMHFSADNGH